MLDAFIIERIRQRQSKEAERQPLRIPLPEAPSPDRFPRRSNQDTYRDGSGSSENISESVVENVLENSSISFGISMNTL
jgi:hypothetical protein